MFTKSLQTCPNAITGNINLQNSKLAISMRYQLNKVKNHCVYRPKIVKKHSEGVNVTSVKRHLHAYAPDAVKIGYLSIFNNDCVQNEPRGLPFLKIGLGDAINCQFVVAYV